MTIDDYFQQLEENLIAGEKLRKEGLEITLKLLKSIPPTMENREEYFKKYPYTIRLLQKLAEDEMLLR